MRDNCLLLYYSNGCDLDSGILLLKIDIDWMYSRDELKQLKIEFWKSFATFCELQPYLRNRPKMWMLHNTTVRGVELKFGATRTAAYVILEVSHKKEDERLDMYEKLTWYKEYLEKDFAEGLIWDFCYEREAGNEVARVYTMKEGIDFHRRSDWGEFFVFMAQNMYLLQNNFEEIADYIRE